MIALIIIFSGTLLILVLLICLKAGQIRTNQIATGKTNEFGDKDSWVKSYVFSFKMKILLASKRLAYQLLIKAIQYWIRSNRAVYKLVKRRFPQLGYLLGERPVIRPTANTEPASPFIAHIKEHQELIRKNGEQMIIETEEEVIQANIVVNEKKPRTRRKADIADSQKADMW
jgi:hypothetical protein